MSLSSDSFCWPLNKLHSQRSHPLLDSIALHFLISGCTTCGDHCISVGRRGDHCMSAERGGDHCMSEPKGVEPSSQGFRWEADGCKVQYIRPMLQALRFGYIYCSSSHHRLGPPLVDSVLLHFLPHLMLRLY